MQNSLWRQNRSIWVIDKEVRTFKYICVLLNTSASFLGILSLNQYDMRRLIIQQTQNVRLIPMLPKYDLFLNCSYPEKIRLQACEYPCDNYCKMPSRPRKPTDSPYQQQLFCEMIVLDWFRSLSIEGKFYKNRILLSTVCLIFKKAQIYFKSHIL